MENVLDGLLEQVEVLIGDFLDLGFDVGNDHAIDDPLQRLA
jgi:hypothetical protein